AVQLRNSALKLLFGWDGEMQVNRPEPLIYAAWARSVQRRLIEDELGLLAREFARPDPNFLERVFRDVDGAAAWCDIVQSQKIENCDDIAVLALDEALSQ
ncbi:MAG: penicillin acylase family protein, partial [Rhodobacteraceae bacterium]|nr:penicillin acylase family protein [Paracoccaceae bacterium]